MNGERMRPEPVRRPEGDADIGRIVENDSMGTWEEIPEAAARAYRDMVETAARDPEAVQQEREMVAQFREIITHLSPRESFLLRMRTGGILDDQPMNVSDVKSIFRGNRKRRAEIDFLDRLDENEIKEVPENDIFARVILTALGKLPMEERVYTWVELSEVLGINRETLRQTYMEELAKLKELLQPLEHFLHE